MNPVLLKPSSDTRAQLVVLGQPRAELEAGAYGTLKSQLFSVVLEAFERVRADFDVVIVEGAGSPAEVNLRAHDIANMGFAEAVDCPVLLIADIDRGGVFAQIVGTLDLLVEDERSRIGGFVINRFRGERKLLVPGIEWLERKTRKPVYGVLPFLRGLALRRKMRSPSRCPPDRTRRSGSWSRFARASATTPTSMLCGGTPERRSASWAGRGASFSRSHRFGRQQERAR